MISDEVGLAIMNECDFDDYTFGSPHNVSDACNHAISEANTIVGNYINPYDVLLDVCYPSIVQQELRLRKLVNPSTSSFLYICKKLIILNYGLCYFRLLKLVLA